MESSVRPPSTRERGENMADTTTTIILTGLVYLSQIQSPPTLQAVLMRSDGDRVSTRGGAIPRHRAFIKILKGSVVSGGRDADVSFTSSNVKLQTNVYYLKGESIEI